MKIEVRKARLQEAKLLPGIDGGLEWKKRIHTVAVWGGRVTIAFIDDEPVGYLRRGSFLWDDRAPFIQSIQVAGDHRWEGVATALVEHIIEQSAKKTGDEAALGIYSSYEATNEPSTMLHKKFGFECVGLLVLPDQAEPEIIVYRPFDLDN